MVPTASLSRFVGSPQGGRGRGFAARALGGALLALAGLVSCGGGGKGSGEAPFRITQFSATPAQVPFGGSARLEWAVSGVPVDLTLNGAKVSGSSATVIPVRRQAFTLAGQNGAGSDTRQVKVAAQGIDLLAGHTVGRGSLDGVGPLAGFNYPQAVAVDGGGNVYVADSENHTIRMVTPEGVVSTVAGAAGMAGSADGLGAAARFDSPSGVAVDAARNVYVADYGNSTIRKVTPAGVVSTLAGTAGVVGALDGTGATANFHGPRGIAVDAGGNVFVADYQNNNLRKVTPAGAVTTLLDNSGAVAHFSGPTSIAVDSGGNLYVGELAGNTVYKMSPIGVIAVLADGSATGDLFNYPAGLAVDAAGNVYVADIYNDQIRRISPAGAIGILAGHFHGSADGTGEAAKFSYPNGVAVAANGTVYVADTSNHTIRKITPEAVVSTLAGSARVRGASGGTGSAARFDWPMGVVSDTAGTLYVADEGTSTIRKVSPAGMVSTLAGSPWATGSVDGAGPAALFRYPQGLAVDATGNVFVADTWNHTIRKVTPAGLVSTLAGGPGLTGTVDGTGALARFRYPSGMAVDAAGNVFVADTENHTIRKITPAGLVSTFAGIPRSSGMADGQGVAAKFSYPSGLAVDAGGNVYVADFGNHTIRKITPTGLVSTLAGTPRASGRTDGPAATARFMSPSGVVVDAMGNVYVADTDNHTIRKITPAGIVSTVAGTAGRPAFVAGPTAAYLVSPWTVALTPDGDLVVPCNNALVQITVPE